MDQFFMEEKQMELTTSSAGNDVVFGIEMKQARKTLIAGNWECLVIQVRKPHQPRLFA